MANLFDNSQPRAPLTSRPLSSGSPAQKPAKPPMVPSRFSANQNTPRPFDRGDKPFQTPTPPVKNVNYKDLRQTGTPTMKPSVPITSPIRPKTTPGDYNQAPARPTPPIPPKPVTPGTPYRYQRFSPSTAPKRMVSSGSTSASQFQRPQPMPIRPKSVPLTPKSRPTPAADTAKTILPPKSFRSRRLSPALMTTMIVVFALVAAGLVGYFVFPTEVKNTYHQVLVAVGIEKTSPLATVPSDTISTTPKLASLDDITFTETSDPASGTSLQKGDRITYTLTLHNSAESELDGLSVSDAIPAATERLTVLSTPTGSKDNSSETNVEIANISLQSGQTQLIRFQVTVKSDTADQTTITNTATLAMNGSRKVSNNNSPSSLAIASALTPNITPVPANTPVITPTPATTPVPTATPVLTPTATPVVTPTPTVTVTAATTATITPTTTIAPEETADRVAPEDQTMVKTGGNSLTYLFVFMALTIIAGITLVFVRRKAYL